MATIRIENISKVYDGKVVGVDDISLDIAEGEFMAFLGPSGCGKTSTLRMIAGLEEITKGNLYFNEQRVNEYPSNRRNVAMAFENYGLYPHLTVFQNIAYPLRLRNIPEDQISKEVVSTAQMLKIHDVLDEKPGGLSGGVQQRISLARALVRKPAVLLLDEPISHLDTELRNQMRGELKRIHALNETTTVYVTHDQLEALTMADRIAVMSQGKIRQVGTPTEIFYSPKDLFVATFVGEPPMNILQGSFEVVEENIVIYVGKDPILSLPLLEGKNLVQESKNSNEVLVGIRPMDFLVSDDPNIGLQTKILLREHLGENTLYHLTSEMGPILFLESRLNQLQEGDDLVIKPNRNRLHFFSKETSMAIKIGKADKLP